eukprot:TRINITY_DN843_c0_g1_i3.p1 TRINITY_DN843_c0_g1~~TRINITY_DN843_c0_g1_i3.p1  ORF type:complete len:244 (+),score=73.77 TRINITY_DN843_c0_g1_i3:327-1058(+)
MSHKHENEKLVVSQAAPIKETRVHDTAIKEVVKPIETEEVQPIIHRDIYTTEVHQTKQPVYQKEVLPTKVEEKILPEQNLREVNKGATTAKFTMDNERSSKYVEDTTHTTVVKPAIIQEVVHPQVITEVQPIIYKEVIAPKVIKEEQHIHEKIVERPVIITENDTLPPPSSATYVKQSEHASEHHHSLKDKLKGLFHAPSAVDTVKPIVHSTPLDSGSVLTRETVVSTPLATSTTTTVTKQSL